MDPTAPGLQPAAPVPGRRSVIPIVLLVGVVVAVLVAGVLVYRVIARPGSVETVARDFVTAVYEEDVAATCDLAAPELLAEEFERLGVQDCDGLVEAVGEASETGGRQAQDVEVLEATEDGDTASLRISSPAGTPGVWSRVDLQRLDGQWRVTDFSG